jgi:hypothetical protein
MRKLFCIMFLVLLCSIPAHANVSDAQDYLYQAASAAQEACSYARKAYYYASDLEEIQYYSRKAMRAAEESESYCGLAIDELYGANMDDAIMHTEDAASYAYSAYRYSRQAYQSSEYDDAQYYARKAMNEASYAESSACDAASECE